MTKHMMSKSFAEQVAEIRAMKQKQYQAVLVKQETELKQSALIKRIAEKLEFDPVKLAAIRISRYVKRHLLKPCANDSVSGMYNIRIDITNHHTFDNHDNDDVTLQSILDTIPKQALFTVAFDLREINNTNTVDIFDRTFYLLKEDIERIKIAWSKVRGDSTYSINYLIDLEYQKTLCRDRMK